MDVEIFVESLDPWRSGEKSPTRCSRRKRIEANDDAVVFVLRLATRRPIAVCARVIIIALEALMPQPASAITRSMSIVGCFFLEGVCTVASIPTGNLFDSTLRHD